MANQPMEPQAKYYDDQDILNVDFDKLYSSFITSIDSVRSHFNAISPNSQELNTPQYQESRAHAFFRMIGFPIVAADGTFHSPGFDPNLNTDSESTAAYQKIDAAVISDNNIKKQLENRELLVYQFRKLFSNGGINAQAIALGSIFIRSFEKQLSDTDPLVLDQSQTQNIDERVSEISSFYTIDSTSILKSVHLLKPFIVDPRFDAAIKPIKNRICAPFLKDKSQTKIFQSSNGVSESLKRPFIERVISIRFNNKNVTTNPGKEFIDQVLNDIKSDDKITDTDLLKATSDALKQLHDSEIIIFDNYFKIMRIIIEKLIDGIKNIQYIRQNINFDPLPDAKAGVEAGTNGGKLASLDPLDKNNRETENNIIFLTQKKVLSDVSFDAGIQGVPDPGDFVFSNLDDSVFSINKNVQKSYEENIKKLSGIRNQLGNEGIEHLKNIEIIMGEFSGIGLIDMIAIQATLWIMPTNSLLGLIDPRAFERIALRSDINLGSASQNDVLFSLKDFEKTLKTIYLIIQDYYNAVNDGGSFSS